jgi:hypothetical protein
MDKVVNEVASADTHLLATEDGAPPPVTVSLRQKVRKSKEAEYNEWQEGILEANKAMDGFLGATIIREEDQDDPDLQLYVGKCCHPAPPQRLPREHPHRRPPPRDSHHPLLVYPDRAGVERQRAPR